jgi:hypothetical protein
MQYRLCDKLFFFWQEHEKTCGKRQISQEMVPEEHPEQQSQVSEKFIILYLSILLHCIDLTFGEKYM